VFGLWSYPPHRAGRLKRSTNNNIEQQSLEFVVYCLAPLAIAIEQAPSAICCSTIPTTSLFIEFNFAGLLRGDLKTRYAAYLIGRQGEWLSANDILRMENMSPRTDEGGDDYKNPLTKDSGAAAGADGDGRIPKRRRAMRIARMAKEKRAKLRQVVAQIAAIDPVVAIELSAMTDCLVRSIAREDALPRHHQRSDPAEQDRADLGLRPADAARQLVRLLAVRHRRAGRARRQ
jgi:hypothetical protein